MLAGEPSDTEDSDAAATVYAEPKLYRTRREQHASLSPDLGETAATARYRERLWSGEMGRRYYRLRAVEKKRTLRKELEARVAAFAEGEATAPVQGRPAAPLCRARPARPARRALVCPLASSPESSAAHRHGCPRRARHAPAARRSPRTQQPTAF
jgi:hypothetical protein